MLVARAHTHTHIHTHTNFRGRGGGVVHGTARHGVLLFAAVVIALPCGIMATHSANSSRVTICLCSPSEQDRAMHFVG